MIKITMKRLYEAMIEEASKGYDGPEGPSMDELLEDVAKEWFLPPYVATAASAYDTLCQALKAGIPRSVIEGKTKLTDHFSQDYIDMQTGRDRG